MKKSIWLFSFIFSVFFACKEEESITPNAISSQEAAVMVGSSFASNSSGVAAISKESANKSENMLGENSGGRTATCGVSQSINLAGASPAGGIITWSYDFRYDFRLNCDAQELANNITVDLSYNGAFDSPTFGFEHAGISKLSLTGLEASAENFLLDGTYNRNGSFKIKTGDQKAGSSSIDIIITDVAIDKTTYKIMSGSSSFLLLGSVSGKGSFKYEGTVEFNGNDTADIKIMNEVFLLNLKDGSVTGK